MDEKLARGLAAIIAYTRVTILIRPITNEFAKALRMSSCHQCSNFTLLQRPDKVLAVQNVTDILALLVDMVRRDIVERKINEAIGRRRELA